MSDGPTIEVELYGGPSDGMKIETLEQNAGVEIQTPAPNCQLWPGGQRHWCCYERVSATRYEYRGQT